MDNQPNPSANHSEGFTDGSTVPALLLRGSSGPTFACGFFSNGDCDTYLFAIFIIQTNNSSEISSGSGFSREVWSANRNNRVRINSTLELTVDGDLVFQDVDESEVCFTGTPYKSVGAGLNLTEMWNLVLFDDKNDLVWDSFEPPTDILVTGRMLIEGKTLTASVSSTNWIVQGSQAANQGPLLLVTSTLFASKPQPIFGFFFLKQRAWGSFLQLMRLLLSCNFGKLRVNGHSQLILKLPSSLFLLWLHVKLWLHF